MTLLPAYCEDLHELVSVLDDRRVFRLGEREAWEEGIDEAGEINELMTTAEGLHKAILGRDGVEAVVTKHTKERTRAFV